MAVRGLCIISNGAATFRPRRGLSPVALELLAKSLQWGRDLSAAERWISFGRRAGPSRFNGAATFRPRRERAGGDDLDHIIAVLQWGRDLSAAESGGSRPRPTASRALQWGRDLSAAESVYGQGQVAHVLVLQWGRDLSAAESSKPRAILFVPNALQWGRDLSAAESKEYFDSVVYFIELQWGRDLSAAESRRAVRAGHRGRASMGPRPFGRGEILLGYEEKPPERLQWGRDLSAAESVWTSAIVGGLRGFNGAATFRPRRDTAHHRVPVRLQASMGPRPFGRGEAYMRLHVLLGIFMLQWGRDLSAAESVGRLRSRAGVHALQWGRDLSAAESWPLCAYILRLK